MKIDELIARLNYWSNVEANSGNPHESDDLAKAAETIKLLWEIARENNLERYKRQIDEMRGEDAVYAETH